MSTFVGGTVEPPDELTTADPTGPVLTDFDGGEGLLDDELRGGGMSELRMMDRWGS